MNWILHSAHEGRAQIKASTFYISSRGVVVRHADSQHRGCQFDSSKCHFENAFGEEGKGKPPRESHFPRESESPVSGFYYARNRVCNAVSCQKYINISVSAVVAERSCSQWFAPNFELRLVYVTFLFF